MRVRFRQLFSGDWWARGERPWYGSLGASTIVHVSLVLVLGCFLFRPPLSREVPGIDSRLAEPAAPVPFEELPPLVEPRPSATPESGGARASVFFPQRPLKASLPTVPAETVPWNLPGDGEALPFADLTAEVGEPAGGGDGDGEGGGTGDGDGEAGKPAFFGLKAEGNSFVYVVDCSGSMNRPHPGEWKTRFKRLKYEIVKSVGALHPGQQFFIIYFNDSCIPMIERPHSRLQPALPRVRAGYLKWMAKQSAFGRTDPRAALQLALRLQPDVIYFLTDGAFPRNVERELLQLRQRRSVIHTFAFGDQKAEPMMKSIAAANGGKYHFIP